VPSVGQRTPISLALAGLALAGLALAGALPPDLATAIPATCNPVASRSAWTRC
jgi:hypothetical protein